MPMVRGSGTRVAVAGVLAMAVVAFARLGHAATSDEDAQLIREANHTVDVYRTADPGINEFFRRSVGYVVFPGIGKGGLGIGGAHGTGVLFEHGAPVGKVTMNQVTVGAQAGGQEFSQIVFFEVPKTLNELKAGKASLSAEASAVALSSGAAAKARFKNGVAVFTATKGGLMLEASVGGQKFKFTPIATTAP
jgi:lipid-binding SYLF domain-containing protein